MKIEDKGVSGQRKEDHLDLAQRAQFDRGIDRSKTRERFFYEPLFAAHPLTDYQARKQRYNFLGKKLRFPVWISSMTGGTGKAGPINHHLARAAGEFGFGFSLGSCRGPLHSKDHWNDFDLRHLVGEDLPFYANLGIAQVEQLISQNEVGKIIDLVHQLKADGLVVHINPLQEWFQPEGDRFLRAPLVTINQLLELVSFPIIVKEVGQGFGPKSLRALMKLPLAAIDFGALGGTNFSLLEILRSDINKTSHLEDQAFAHIGHTAEEMVEMVAQIFKEEEKDILCRNFIISGGVRDTLEGCYLVHKLMNSVPEGSGVRAIFAQAKKFLDHATEDYEKLERYCESIAASITLAESYLDFKN